LCNFCLVVGNKWTDPIKKTSLPTRFAPYLDILVEGLGFGEGTLDQDLKKGLGFLPPSP
jgi:hypothetical protein